MNVRYIKSAKSSADYPPPSLPEVAVVGRSNAGKSSFINALTGQKIAKVSGTPGKTRLINFFELNGVGLVDMPGYGFATGDREEVGSWKEMIEDYLKNRDTLNGVLLIVDIRRDWDEQEEMLRQWLEHHEIPWALVLNKSDKLSKSQADSRRKAFVESSGAQIYVLSSLKKQGLDEIKKLVFKEWAK